MQDTFNPGVHAMPTTPPSYVRKRVSHVQQKFAKLEVVDASSKVHWCELALLSHERPIHAFHVAVTPLASMKKVSRQVVLHNELQTLTVRSIDLYMN